jgi:hypothetical protein
MRMTTIDLELAKELKEICKEKGIELPESELIWYRSANGDIYATWFKSKYNVLAPAYTLDELLGILSLYPPYEVDLSYQHTDGNGVVCKDWTALFEIHGIDYCESDPNPANAACKLLIWLIKEGLTDMKCSLCGHRCVLIVTLWYGELRKRWKCANCGLIH